MRSTILKDSASQESLNKPHRYFIIPFMLYAHIQDYLSRDIYPFHMPGHKRNPAFLPRDLLRLDMTEITGMDNLHAPEGVILKLQNDLAARYGADESFFLVNGSTAGLTAAICAVCAEGEPLYTARNCHAAVYRAMALAGANPVYLMPDYTSGGLAGGIKPEKLQNAVGAAVITSPTYEGYVSDIAAFSETLHRNHKILIVDEAHGAHFLFHSAFPVSALALGADIVINSLHKTLPALSQCAVLHVKGPRVDRERLRFYLQAVQTSSPSYLFMASADYMLQMLSSQPDHFEKYAARLAKLRNALPCMDNAVSVRLMGREQVGRDSVYDLDTGKLLFYTDTGLDGTHLTAMLADQFRVQPEMTAGRYILAMTSVADTDEGFDRLTHAVHTLNQQFAPTGEQADLPALLVPEVVLPPREAMRCETVLVDWPTAIGRVSGGFLTPYPPGIPIIAPGERITEAHYHAASAYDLAADYIKIINHRSE